MTERAFTTRGIMGSHEVMARRTEYATSDARPFGHHPEDGRRRSLGVMVR